MTKIKQDRRNYRVHNDENKRVIRKSLEELGAGRSIVIDNEGEIIAGNGVYEQAQKLGIKTKIVETDGSELVVVKRTDLATGDDKRKKLALADNAASDTSEWADELLREDWTPEVLADFGVVLPDVEIQNETEEAQEDDFDEDNEQIEPVTKPGDIWQLGRHRLLCGDSTDPAQIAKLMGGGISRSLPDRSTLQRGLRGKRRTEDTERQNGRQRIPRISCCGFHSRKYRTQTRLPNLHLALRNRGLQLPLGIQSSRLDA